MENKIKELLKNEEFISSLLLPGILKEIQEIKSKVKTVEEENKRLKNKIGRCQQKLDDYEQYRRRLCLRILGVKESKSECTDNLVLDIFQNKLNLNLNVNDISRSHRTGSLQKNNILPRPIIVQFSSYRTRNLVFTNKKKLKSTGITIKEDLTKARAGLLRKATNIHNFQNVWTSDGRIRIRSKDGKVNTVTTEDQLLKLSL